MVAREGGHGGSARRTSLVCLYGRAADPDGHLTDDVQTSRLKNYAKAETRSPHLDTIII